ncbi:peptide chain release factor N(5)-glutamine methyltransferase [Geobacter sp. DSM 9736]|uniref:peptide chain release factor N(5)-glutamine methyltransferase n=1 Tax=Geobacter sp. DSM 9736 TaxID=1277350 RepID=UPI000B50D7AA|nr:peptide chain release factor N(5)-glutamine methyltransferase [Geobacter sp. DSM 9736]SNB47786.1 [protein release factor]-glutamine N5-methyltransferase [Geobacter sp. DSM 9736]
MAEKQEIWTIRRVLEWTRGYLAEKGVENARLETEWLLAAALGLDRVGLYVNFDKPLTDEELAGCRTMVSRRARREPLQYILGTQEFMGLEFRVTPAVLIPRHDTEVLVEEAVRRAPSARTILDVGTGSGCIAVALAKALPEAVVTGADTSSAALAIAGENAELNCVRITLVEGSLFTPFTGRTFDLIVSNPPYIRSEDIATLQPEVRDFEPAAALDGGADGFGFYRSIVPAAPRHLTGGGWLMVEVGVGQAGDVASLFAESGFLEVFTARDRGGVERVVGGCLP